MGNTADACCLDPLASKLKEFNFDSYEIDDGHNEITIANDNAIAVSLNKVPAIPSMNINGKKTATKVKVVAIIAIVFCFDPL